MLTRAEVERILMQLPGTYQLLGRLMYGKGNKDRITMLPVSLVRPLSLHLRKLHAW